MPSTSTENGEDKEVHDGAISLYESARERVAHRPEDRRVGQGTAGIKA